STLVFHTPIIAISTGRLRSQDAVRKCSSIKCAPASILRKPSMPTVSAIGRPIADHSEYRPPTHSHICNWFSSLMPHSVIFATADETPRKWQCNTPLLLPNVRCNHCRAVSALLSVSMVVNDLEEMMNRVECGFRVRSSCDNWLPSMVEAKCTVSRDEVGIALSHSASLTIKGPRSEPPTPILT